MTLLYAVYHIMRGYYNFGSGKFDNNHEYNFNIEFYATNNKDVAEKLCAQYNAELVEI